MKTKQKLASITGAGREVIECRKEEDSEKAKAWPDTPAQSATLANSMKTKKTERSAVNAVEAAHNYRQHAQCLADALKLLLADHIAMSKERGRVIGKYGIGWRPLPVQETAKDALAQWEKEAKTLDNYGYPTDWPTCPGCGLPAMDGHITCGRAECNEGSRR